MTRRALLLLCLLAAPGLACAHSMSNAFLNLRAEGAALDGTLRLRLQDAAVMAALDTNGDRQITWGEVKAGRSALDDYIARRVLFRTAAGACGIQTDAHRIEDLHTGRFLVVPLRVLCQGTGSIDIEYELLNDVDAAHRGVLELRAGAAVHTAVLGPERPRVTITPDRPTAWRSFLEFFRQGVTHILSGYDHLLFLFALLLPLFALRERAARRVLGDVVKTVTAFTLAHSLTLLLSSVFALALDSALVEVLIALTVVLSGINLLRPLFGRAHTSVAFAFGLIHGLGFAGALSDLSLPVRQFARSLVGFNLGVEAGQLLLVLCVFPVLLALRERAVYLRVVMPAAAVTIVAVGGFWVLERGTGLSIPLP